MTVRYETAQWATVGAGKDCHILEPKTGAPERIEMIVVVFCNQFLVNVVSNLEIVAITAWEEDAVDF